MLFHGHSLIPIIGVIWNNCKPILCLCLICIPRERVTRNVFLGLIFFLFVCLKTFKRKIIQTLIQYFSDLKNKNSIIYTTFIIELLLYFILSLKTVLLSLFLYTVYSTDIFYAKNIFILPYFYLNMHLKFLLDCEVDVTCGCALSFFCFTNFINLC